MKDIAEADIILNIKLLRDGNNWITVVQSHYVEKVLSRFAYFDGKSSLAPYDNFRDKYKSDNSMDNKNISNMSIEE
jgi:hypothetical protein